MSVLLTIQHRLRMEEAVCAYCQEPGMCVLASVREGARTDETTPVCPHCLQTERETTIVLTPSDFGSGARAPTAEMKRTANRRELKLAKVIGGNKQPASGALPYAKGDVIKRGEWVGDDKTCRTTEKGYRLTLDFLTKIRSWCKGREKFFITIGFLHPVTQQVQDEVVVIDRHVFEELFHAGKHR